MAREAADTKGVVQAPRRKSGRPRHAVDQNEPQPQADPEYKQMDVDHQVEDDAEAMEEDMEDDSQQQRQWRRGKKVVEPDLEPLDDYPGGPHDTTLLTRYHCTWSGRRLREWYVLM